MASRRSRPALLLKVHTRLLRLRIPETLRWNAQGPVELRGSVFPGDRHRQLHNRVVVVELAEPREESVIDITIAERDRVGILQRNLLRHGEQRARLVLAELEDLLRRDAETAADGSIDILSELAAVQGGDAAVEERPQSGVDES